MDYMTTGEAARICDVRVNTIKHWIQKGSIEAVLTPGGHWRIPKEAFSRFLHAWNIPAPITFQEKKETPRILIVDDDPQIHELIRGAMDLAPFSCEVSSAYDGYAGLVQIGLIRPQLLILDVMMPEINGLEMIQRLKMQPELGEGMCILALTGARDRKLVVRRLEEAGPDAILFKPVDIQELLKMSERLLGGKTRANRRKTTHAA